MMFPDRCFKTVALRSPARSRSLCGRPKQGGSMLLEAMVGIVISAALGLGIAYSAARALKAQRYSSTHSMAVLNMRALLSVPADLSAWCTTGSGALSLSLNNVSATGVAGTGVTSAVPYALSCSVLTVTITGASQSAAVSLERPAALSTTNSGGTASSLFGGGGVITFSP